MVIEIVDSEKEDPDFLPTPDGMTESGRVTLEKAKVLRYNHRPS